MEISIDREKKRFHQFIGEEGNNNFIFSGVFGIGKSYFLNKFFNEFHKDEYIGIFLSPVNYSVASNEDIFEYIKVDVLLQILSKIPCDFERSKISFSTGTFFYLKNHIDNFFGTLFNLAEKIYLGTDLISSLSSFKKEINKYITKNSKDEGQEVQSFLHKIASRPGSIYESNLITQIILNLIEDAKTNMKTNKKVILVIDDLDRIDPEHIFRILNILSVHNDFENQQEHKFGFDKTILVCDIANIRNIYRAKYGINVDFNGYIDKFYSKEIYYFHNEEAIINNIANQVCCIDIDKETTINDPYSIIHESLVYILSIFIKTGKLNLRSLLKMKGDYHLNGYISYNFISKCSIKKIPAMSILELLERIFTSSSDLEDALSDLTKNFTYLKSRAFNEKDFLQIFVPLADYPQNNFEVQVNSKNDITQYTYKNISYFLDNRTPWYATDSLNYSQNVNLFEVLKDAYDNYKRYFSVIQR